MLSLSKQIDAVLQPVYKQRGKIIALKAANILVSILPPLLTTQLIDNLLQDSGSQAIQYILTIAGILVVYFVLDWGQDYFWHRMEYIGTGLVRAHIFSNVVRKNYMFFKEHNIGEIESKVVHDAEIYAQSKLSRVPLLILNVMHVAVILIILLFINLILMLTVTAFGVVFYIFYKFINKRLRVASLKEREGLTDVLTNTNEILAGAPTIQLYGEAKYFAKRFGETVDKYEHLLIKLRKWKGLALASTNKIVGLLPLAVVFVGLGLYATGAISMGYVFMFYILLPYLADPIKSLTEYNIDTQNARAVERRLEEMLSEKKTKRIDLVSIDKINRLEFMDISYSYTNDNPVLEYLSFNITPKDAIAVVGPSGAGKTTFLRMLKRQVLPTSGKILVNGIGLNDIAEKSYLNRVTVVSQEIFVFDANIRENIKFGKEVTDERMARIVELCALEHLNLDDNALNLSAGERQRLGLARALACEFDILILDEPTAELDHDTELRIIETLKRVQQKRECMLIVVTHSKSVINELCNKMLNLGKKGKMS